MGCSGIYEKEIIQNNKKAKINVINPIENYKTEKQNSIQIIISKEIILKEKKIIEDKKDNENLEKIDINQIKGTSNISSNKIQNSIIKDENTIIKHKCGKNELENNLSHNNSQITIEEEKSNKHNNSFENIIIIDK